MIDAVDIGVVGTGTLPECIIIFDNMIFFYDDWTTTYKAHSFDGIFFGDTHVQLLANEAVIIAKNLNPNPELYVLAVRIDPNGDIISNLEFPITVDTVNSIQFNPFRNVVEFGVFYSGTFYLLPFNNAGDQLTYHNETTGTYNEIDYLYGSNNIYTVYKDDSESKMNIYHKDKSLSLPNPLDEIWINFSLTNNGVVPSSTMINDSETYVPGAYPNPTITSITNPNFLNASLVTSVMGSCINYNSNPFGRSPTHPYSFTQESLQDVDLFSPFWTDPGLGTGEVKILELDGTEVSWLSIHPSTGNLSGKSPLIENNYIFNFELEFSTASLTVRFYLNIKKWEFSNWKIWTLESWNECEEGYQLDEGSQKCKEKGIITWILYYRFNLESFFE